MVYQQHGLTPLHMSCQGNHVKTSAILIDSKAPVNAVATVSTWVYFQLLWIHLSFVYLSCRMV